MQLRLVIAPEYIRADLHAWHFNVPDAKPDLGTPSYFVSWQKLFFLLPTLRWNNHAKRNELHGQGLIFVKVLGLKSESRVRAGRVRHMLRDCSTFLGQGLKLPGALDESSTELRMSTKEHLPVWLDSDGRMVIKIQREGRTLQRCVVADARGKSFPVLLELTADQSFQNWRPPLKNQTPARGLAAPMRGGVGLGDQGRILLQPLQRCPDVHRDSKLHAFFCTEVPVEARKTASGPFKPRDSIGFWT